MPDTLTAADFEQRVQQVSERLDELRGASRPVAPAAGPYVYAGLDLADELPQMAPVLAALLNQDPDEPLTTNVRLEVGARRLGLATIVTLLKGGEGLVDFNARYQELMGVEPDYAAFERLLPTAMREGGLPLPPRQDARRLLEALQLVAGLPASLVEAMAEYFVIYWRLFHPQPNPLSPLEALSEGREGAASPPTCRAGGGGRPSRPPAPPPRAGRSAAPAAACGACGCGPSRTGAC